jgi:hypothetical protein
MLESGQPQRPAISVSDMARMLGLSRSRFHQLIHEGVFPQPQRHGELGRPFYDLAGQDACLKVRRTNTGVNGRTIMFYARRVNAVLPTRPSKPKPSPRSQTKTASRSRSSATAGLIDGLKQLGLADATDAKVAEAIRICFPEGIANQPHEAVLLSVFRHLVRRDSGDSHRR